MLLSIQPFKEMIRMKKVNLAVALFTGLFVAIIVVVSGYFMPDRNLLISSVIAILAALIGYTIGQFLFSKK